jgi:hypothetical protein
MTHALGPPQLLPPGRVRRPRSPGLGTRRCFNTADDLIRVLTLCISLPVAPSD